MATKVGSAKNFQQNELQNPRLHQLASAPGTPVEGQFWYNTTTKKFEFRDDTKTVDPTARSSHTGTQLANTVSDFATAARAALATADVPMGGNTFTGLRDPSAAQEAATKAYVDNKVNGTDWKESVRVATTGNLASLSGLLTIDGITLQAGDRILVKDQTTAAQNGIYVAASGAWTRAADANTNTLTADAALFVEEGTQADTQWRLTTNNPLVVGTTALTFAQIGAATSYSQGAGITIAGNVVSIDTTVVARKYETDIGGSTSMAVTHNLGTRAVIARVYDNTTFEELEVDVVHTSASVVTIGTTVAPAAAAWHVVVIG